MNSWLTPQVDVTLNGESRDDTLVQMSIEAARNLPIVFAELTLSNVHNEYSEGASDGDELLIEWGWRGHDLNPLFDGTVKDAHAHPDRTLNLIGLCRGRALADRVTQTYMNEQADAIVRHLVDPLGFSSLDIADCSTVIDTLPLVDTRIASALFALNRRLVLGYELWTDASGGFHWGQRDLHADSVHTFTWQDDVIRYEHAPNGRKRMTVVGTPLWHSCVVEVVDRDDIAKRYYIEGLAHYTDKQGNKGSGLYSQFMLLPIEEES